MVVFTSDVLGAPLTLTRLATELVTSAFDSARVGLELFTALLAYCLCLATHDKAPPMNHTATAQVDDRDVSHS